MKQSSEKVLSRRTALAGAGVVGAAAAAAALMPTQPAQQPVAQAADAAGQGASADAGYRLTEHIKRYYSTARV